LLFIFSTYLYNISSYLKTRSLTGRIVDQSIKALRKLENRKIAREEAFIDSDSNRERLILKITSPEEGVLRFIDWNKMATNMSKQGLLSENIKIEWLIALGDWINKNSTIAYIYILNEKSGIKENTDNSNDAEINQERSDPNLNKLRNGITAALIIGKKRSLSNDPLYGLEVLRNIALKSRDQSDINSIEASINGMFRLLNHVISVDDVRGLPFELTRRSNGDGQTNESPYIVVDTKGEARIVDAILLELGDIYSSCKPNRHLVTIIRQFAKEYSSLSIELLDNGAIDAFIELTAWYSQLGQSASSFAPVDIIDSKVQEILLALSKDLSRKYPYAVEPFQIYMRAHIHRSEAQ